MNKYTLTTKERKITALPMRPESDFDKWFLPNPLIRKPKSGNNGTKYARFIEPILSDIAAAETAAILVIK
jgi:hypothetical protein